jgi:lipopolysaccharide export system protein LptA
MYSIKNSFTSLKSKMTFLLFVLIQFSLSAQKGNFSVSKDSSDSEADTTVNKKDVEIIHADKLQFYKNKEGQPIRKMIGNVQLKQDSTYLYCDSAFLMKEKNSVKMYGHVRINDGDSIEATSKKLEYDGNKQTAKLIGDAILTDSKMVLSSDILYYDKNTGIGYYLNNGTLVNQETTLTSKKGYYHSKTSEAYFSDNVHIEDPQYQLGSDTLMFNTNTKVTYFYGNTSIYNEESTIICNNGTYDTKRQVATFGLNTTILNDPQTLWADSLYYEKQNGYGKVMKSFKWKDEEMKVGLEGTDAEYFEKRKEIISYNRPILNSIIEDDTLFLRGDTIIARNDSTKSFNAFKNVRVFKTDLQAVCDSLFYNNSDSVLQLFQNPILWNEGSEMKSDSVFVFIKKGKVNQISFIDNSFILTQSKGKLFDQIKGKKITAFFKDSKLEKMLVVRNAESLYFGKDEQENYMGGNQSKSAKMWIYTKENQIKKIVFLEKPEAVFTPLGQMSNTDIYLKDFKTNFELKPSSKYDL